MQQKNYSYSVNKNRLLAGLIFLLVGFYILNIANNLSNKLDVIFIVSGAAFLLVHGIERSISSINILEIISENPNINEKDVKILG